MNLNDQKLWTALVTPFNSDLSVDWDSLKSLIQEQVTAKNGLLILGSTGEALNIGLADRKKIVKFTIALNPTSPIMIGVGGHNLAETREWVSYLNTQKLDAYLMVTPLYSKPGDEGQYEWFKNLMDLAQTPVMLYNVPGRTGTALSLTAVKRLKNHKNFWAIKEASGSVENFREYIDISGAPVYCGDDGLMPEFALSGAAGLISVASNVWPLATHLYTDQCLNKTFDAKELWTNAANTMFISSNPVPAKAFLKFKNRISNNKMMPPLSENDLKDISEIERADQSIKDWYQKQSK